MLEKVAHDSSRMERRVAGERDEPGEEEVVEEEERVAPGAAAEVMR
jgi:hypothetical protein